MSHLDLQGNGLEKISHLEALPVLSCLFLDQNSLSSLEIPAGRRLDHLRIIRVSGNKFQSFDVTPFPNIRTLYIDDNSLEKIHGLRRAKHLDSLSMRDQRKEVDRL